MVDSWVLRQQGLNVVLLEIQFALFRKDLDRFGCVEDVGVVVARIRNFLSGRGEGGFKAGSDDADWSFLDHVLELGCRLFWDSSCIW